ncbi:methyl-accepting chemotaxis protein [Desulforamulus putei]|uniref:methyl-accepting chemotaxis protein n=1 Tax=Desulforamulus putei TaxID=74701 RepID=UPI002FDEC2DC
MAVYEFVCGFALASIGGAAAFHRLKKRYATIITRIEEETAHWHRMELPPVCRIDDTKEFSRLSNAVCGLTGKVRHLAQEIQLTSQQVRAASSQLDVSVRSASDISSAFMQIQDIAATVQTTGDVLEKDFLASEKAVQESINAIESVNKAIGGITSSNNRLNHQISTLKEAVEQVRLISQNIGEISGQTKLLALNAAIEAARAGEHGRGFGVVAEEIGKLSDLTAGAVKQTSDVLEQIKQDVATVVGSITESMDSSQTAADQLNNVQKVFTRSFDFIYKVNNTARETLCEINSSLQQVASVLELRKRDLESVVNTGKLMANLADDLEKAASGSQLTYVIQQEAVSRIEHIKSQLTQTAGQHHIISLDPARHKSVLSRLKGDNPDIEAIWSNDTEGVFLFSEPAAGLANAKVREWWQRAMKGETFISPVYISAITRQPCLTVSVPVYRGKEVIGVLGADVSLS